MIDRITLFDELDTAEKKAWDALSRYKFWMFGYHASRWVYLVFLWKRETKERVANPFRYLVDIARHKLKQYEEYQ